MKTTANIRYTVLEYCNLATTFYKQINIKTPITESFHEGKTKISIFIVPYLLYLVSLLLLIISCTIGSRQSLQLYTIPISEGVTTNHVYNYNSNIPYHYQTLFGRTLRERGHNFERTFKSSKALMISI